MKIQNVILWLGSLSLAGCLITRQDVREGKGPQLSPEQQRQAQHEVRYQELDEQMRQMMGRIETVENNISTLNSAKSSSHNEQQNEKRSLQEKLKIYEEALGKLESQYLILAQKIEALQLAQASTPVKDSKSVSNKNAFEAAEMDYAKKRWKEAIVSFEKYRSLNPTGKRYGEATYKIGASFHELGMNVEAKSFYSEVVEKFPKSDWAKKANQRLKALK